MNYFNLPLSSYSSSSYTSVCWLSVELYQMCIYMTALLWSYAALGNSGLASLFPASLPHLMFLPTSSLSSSTVGLCKWWINSLSVALLLSNLTACVWTWSGDDPSCYLSEETLPEMWKPWGRCTKQGRGALAHCILSLTGLVNVTKCYLQHCPMSASLEDS